MVSDVELIADRILMLDAGRMLADSMVWELTEQLYGRVYETELTLPLEELEEVYQVSSVYHRKGNVYAKVIAKEGEPQPKGAVLVYPDLEDVYLSYFGEEV